MDFGYPTGVDKKIVLEYLRDLETSTLLDMRI
jgi:hypothetical protein